MMTHTPPTTFVALQLAPGQFDLFDEILEEAEELLDTLEASRSGSQHDGDDLVFLNRDAVRLGLGWVELPHGDALTLAVGATPDEMLDGDLLRHGAQILRALTTRAEALFDAHQTLWQVAEVPLTAESMDDHATQLALLEHDTARVAPLQPEEARMVPLRMPARDEAELDVLAGLRAAVEVEEGPSVAMQMSAFALSTACLIVNPPVGASMLTYAALRQYEGIRPPDPVPVN